MARTLYDKLWDEHVVHTEEDGILMVLIIVMELKRKTFIYGHLLN